MAGGIVCALLALCVLVSYFNVDALLLAIFTVYQTASTNSSTAALQIT